MDFNNKIIIAILRRKFIMMNETIALEGFRKLICEAHEKGETALLIWKNPEERENGVEKKKKCG